MSTVTVTHTLKDQGAVNMPNVPIEVRLSETGWRGDDSQIPTKQPYVTDAAGACAMILERNQDILPGGSATYYIASVMLPPKYGGPKRFTFRATITQSLIDSIVAV